MKYSVSGRQPKSVLQRADEIIMRYEDIDRIIDYIVELPDKTIVYHIPKGATDVNWTKLKTYNEQGKLILSLEDLHFAKLCVDNGFKFYWSYPITTHYELNGIIALGPSYLFLGAPLCFELDKIKKKTNIPIRLCPNVAAPDYIPRENGICGQWIRPEDVAAYEKYVDVLDFISRDLTHEESLLHIYKENQSWPGNLNLLLTNFNFHVDNRGIPDEIGETRATCGQRCMTTSGCRFCETAVKFSEALRIKHEKMRKEKTV